MLGGLLIPTQVTGAIQSPDDHQLFAARRGVCSETTVIEQDELTCITPPGIGGRCVGAASCFGSWSWCVTLHGCVFRVKYGCQAAIAAL